MAVSVLGPKRSVGLRGPCAVAVDDILVHLYLLPYGSDTISAFRLRLPRLAFQQ